MISRADHAFLGDVSWAVFQNPFSEARHAVDLRIADATGDEDRATLLDKVIGQVRARLQRLGPDPISIDAFDGEDRTLVERALLFVVFHDHSPPLDEHIRAQVGSPDTLLPFGHDVFATLRRHGFDRPSAARLTGVIFQMRRAFYFIDGALTGAAPCMRSFREQLWSNVMTNDIGRYTEALLDRMEDFSTILLGETGSGKGAAAAAIGQSGYIPYDPKARRFTENFAAGFTPINLSQYPAALIESELFGHRKGAFTGAVEAHAGVFSRCTRRGAVFLDEIGEVSTPVQIKLLRVLQERQFSPVGSHEVRRFSGRVIAATHRDLSQLRADGRFRSDFYYRLCTDVIDVPPLRQRLAEDPGELARLVGELLRRILLTAPGELTAEVATAIAGGLPAAYAWPGNVRELEQAIRRTLIGRAYRGDDGGTTDAPWKTIQSGVQSGALSARGLVEQYCRLLYERHGTYEEVARRTELDRRTVKKHVGS